jgi:hypothetical protein
LTRAGRGAHAAAVLAAFVVALASSSAAEAACPTARGLGFSDLYLPEVTAGQRVHLEAIARDGMRLHPAELGEPGSSLVFALVPGLGDSAGVVVLRRDSDSLCVVNTWVMATGAGLGTALGPASVWVDATTQTAYLSACFDGHLKGRDDVSVVRNCAVLASDGRSAWLAADELDLARPQQPVEHVQVRPGAQAPIVSLWSRTGVVDLNLDADTRRVVVSTPGE